MIVIISPAKKLNFKDQTPIDFFTQPLHTDISERLIKHLVNLSPQELAQLMHISPNLSVMNKERYLKWKPTQVLSAESKQAAFAFDGNVYQGWNPHSQSADCYDYMQHHVRILSGLYGLLRPFDLIMPHRLEMGTKLETEMGKNLYDVWQHIVTQDLNDTIAQTQSEYLVNLASQEYAKAVRQKEINAKIIQPIFKDKKRDTYKVIAVYAKKARGEMLRFIMDHKITQLDDLKLFEGSGYFYNDKMSTENQLVFTRG